MALRIAHAIVISGDGIDTVIPEIRSIDGINFMKIAVTSAGLKKLFGFSTKDYGLSGSPFLTKLRKMRDQAVDHLVLKELGKENDPFAKEARTRPKLPKGTEIAKYTTLQFDGRGDMLVTTDMCSKAAVFVELTVDNIEYIRSMIKAEDGAGSKRRKRSNVESSDGVRWDKERFCYYVYKDGKRRSFGVIRVDDEDEQNQLYNDAWEKAKQSLDDTAGKDEGAEVDEVAAGAGA